MANNKKLSPSPATRRSNSACIYPVEAPPANRTRINGDTDASGSTNTSEDPSDYKSGFPSPPKGNMLSGHGPIIASASTTDSATNSIQIPQPASSPAIPPPVPANFDDPIAAQSSMQASTKESVSTIDPGPGPMHPRLVYHTDRIHETSANAFRPDMTTPPTEDLRFLQSPFFALSTWPIISTASANGIVDYSARSSQQRTTLYPSTFYATASPPTTTTFTTITGSNVRPFESELSTTVSSSLTPPPSTSSESTSEQHQVTKTSAKKSHSSADELSLPHLLRLRTDKVHHTSTNALAPDRIVTVTEGPFSLLPSSLALASSTRTLMESTDNLIDDLSPSSRARAPDSSQQSTTSSSAPLSVTPSTSISATFTISITTIRDHLDSAMSILSQAVNSIQIPPPSTSPESTSKRASSTKTSTTEAMSSVPLEPCPMGHHCKAMRTVGIHEPYTSTLAPDETTLITKTISITNTVVTSSTSPKPPFTEDNPDFPTTTPHLAIRNNPAESDTFAANPNNGPGPEVGTFTTFAGTVDGVKHPLLAQFALVAVGMAAGMVLGVFLWNWGCPWCWRSVKATGKAGGAVAAVAPAAPALGPSLALKGWLDKGRK